MLPEDCLYMAHPAEVYDKTLNTIVRYTEFLILPDTYKTRVYNTQMRTVALGDIKGYLDGNTYEEYHMQRMYKNVRSNVKVQEALLNEEPTLF